MSRDLGRGGRHDPSTADAGTAGVAPGKRTRTEVLTVQRSVTTGGSSSVEGGPRAREPGLADDPFALHLGDGGEKAGKAADDDAALAAGSGATASGGSKGRLTESQRQEVGEASRALGERRGAAVKNYYQSHWNEKWFKNVDAALLARLAGAAERAVAEGLKGVQVFGGETSQPQFDREGRYSGSVKVRLDTARAVGEKALATVRTDIAGTVAEELQKLKAESPDGHSAYYLAQGNALKRIGAQLEAALLKASAELDSDPHPDLQVSAIASSLRLFAGDEYQEENLVSAVQALGTLGEEREAEAQDKAFLASDVKQLRLWARVLHDTVHFCDDDQEAHLRQGGQIDQSDKIDGALGLLESIPPGQRRFVEQIYLREFDESLRSVIERLVRKWARLHSDHRALPRETHDRIAGDLAPRDDKEAQQRGHALLEAQVEYSAECRMKELFPDSVLKKVGSDLRLSVTQESRYRDTLREEKGEGGKQNPYLFKEEITAKVPSILQYLGKLQKDGPPGSIQEGFERYRALCELIGPMARDQLAALRSHLEEEGKAPNAIGLLFSGRFGSFHDHLVMEHLVLYHPVSPFLDEKQSGPGADEKDGQRPGREEGARDTGSRRERSAGSDGEGDPIEVEDPRTGQRRHMTPAEAARLHDQLRQDYLFQCAVWLPVARNWQVREQRYLALQHESVQTEVGDALIRLWAGKPPDPTRWNQPIRGFEQAATALASSHVPRGIDLFQEAQRESEKEINKNEQYLKEYRKKGGQIYEAVKMVRDTSFAAAVELSGVLWGKGGKVAMRTLLEGGTELLTQLAYENQIHWDKVGIKTMEGLIVGLIDVALDTGKAQGTLKDALKKGGAGAIKAAVKKVADEKWRKKLVDTPEEAAKELAESMLKGFLLGLLGSCKLTEGPGGVWRKTVESILKEEFDVLITNIIAASSGKKIELKELLFEMGRACAKGILKTAMKPVKPETIFDSRPGEGDSHKWD